MKIKPFLRVSEKKLLEIIASKTFSCNKDNISRTNAYFQFFQQYPEIRWAFLAHMVSRNAGWSMCHLEGALLSRLLEPEKRRELFHAYERANWLIFQDAYPQLLLYHYSTKAGKPMFHLCKYFHISLFMEAEWDFFWHRKDMNRLMISLIINEQNVIQRPVLENSVLKKKVFHTANFLFQDWLHFSFVLFPTMEGRLFGASVNGFRSVTKRIDLGKRLADILFDETLFPDIYRFAANTPHTGSNADFEQYLSWKQPVTTPPLHSVYPVIRHQRGKVYDWSLSTKLRRKWFSKKITHRHPIHLTDWYKDKQEQLQGLALLKEFFSRIGKK